MIKIKFADNDTFYSVNFRRLNNHVVYIIGTCPTDLTGFVAYKEDGVTVLGEYRHYTTLYRRVSDGIQLSDDGSTWQEETRTVDIFADWADTADEQPLRPSELVLTVTNTVTSQTIQLLMKASESWTNAITNVPVSQDYQITNAEDTEHYDHIIVDNHTVLYKFNGPSWADRIESQVFYTAMETDTLLEE